MKSENGHETSGEVFPLSSTLTHKFLFQWPATVRRGCTRYTIHGSIVASSLDFVPISIPISIPPLPIEINLPAFYNAIATRSDGGWFITTIFQRGNTFGGERGDDGYGNLVQAGDGLSQKPVEKFVENYVSRFNLRQCVRARAKKLSWLRRRKSSIHLFLFLFVASIFIRLA